MSRDAADVHAARLAFTRADRAADEAKRELNRLKALLREARSDGDAERVRRFAARFQHAKEVFNECQRRNTLARRRLNETEAISWSVPEIDECA